MRFPSLHRLGRVAGPALFRSRDALVPVAIVLLTACSRRQDFLAPPALDPWLDALGFATVFAGLAIRSIVLGTSGIRRSGIRRRVVAEILHDTGPYAWCRNPLYLGNAVILIGLSLVFDSRWMVAIALPAALLAIWSIVVTEERMLRATFGARYDEYCARVPRFWPRRPLGADGVRQLDWRRALRKEHGTIFSAVTAAAIFAIAEDYARAAGAEWHRQAWQVVCAWLLFAALWAIVRLLKHRGSLS
jgi:protein-S-isoprenylcysteine O-methyltransferase Ste14